MARARHGKPKGGALSPAATDVASVLYGLSSTEKAHHSFSEITTELMRRRPELSPASARVTVARGLRALQHRRMFSDGTPVVIQSPTNGRYEYLPAHLALHEFEFGWLSRDLEELRAIAERWSRSEDVSIDSPAESGKGELHRLTERHRFLDLLASAAWKFDAVKKRTLAKIFGIEGQSLPSEPERIHSLLLDVYSYSGLKIRRSDAKRAQWRPVVPSEVAERRARDCARELGIVPSPRRWWLDETRKGLEDAFAEADRTRQAIRRNWDKIQHPREARGPKKARHRRQGAKVSPD